VVPWVLWGVAGALHQCPRATPASLRVVPSACAFLAICAALSYPMWGFRAVTSIRLSRTNIPIRSVFASISDTHRTVKLCAASASRRMDCKTLKIIRGLKTFSSNCPPAPPMVTATWLPMTCAHTMVSASHCVGLTLPGMMDDPGSLAGKEISPMPQRGPEASRRVSFATFMSPAAVVFSAPDRPTSASCAAMPAKVFLAGRKSRPVSAATRAAIRPANSGCVLMPVPTAVPPCARSNTGPSAARRPATAAATCAA